MKKKYILLFIFALFFFLVPYYLHADIPAEINDNSVRIRSGAGTNNSILYTVSSGTPISLVDKTLYSGTGCSAKWYKINYNNKTGYVCSAYVTIIDNTYKGINVVDYTARVNSNNVNVRKGATTSSSALDSLSLGVNVQIVSTVNANNSGCSSNKWYKIVYYNNKVGYICSNYVTKKEEITASDAEYEQVLRNAGFPNSYIPYLVYMHKKYPNWTFVAKNTNSNFATAVDAEEGKNYMQTKNDYYRTSSTPAEGSSWFRVNQGVIAFYMDPRNWLEEERIFMFEKLDFENTFDSRYPSLIKSVFGNGKLSADQYTIPMYNSGKKYGISPLHLASRIRLEVGANGSDSTSGGSFTYGGKTYSGYYNFFNIGAYEKNGYSAIVMGLVTAMNNGWNTIEKAIDGGASFLANGYINQGQGTLYYQKFNVRPKATYSSYTHQYMTNIQAPATEGNQTYNSYRNSGILSNSFIFEIPVYNNMPAYTSLPDAGDTNNNLKTLTIKDHELSPKFDSDVLTYEVEVDKDTTELDITAESESLYATVSGAGKVNIDQNQTLITITVKPQVGEEKKYIITVNVKEDETDNNQNTTEPTNNENNNNTNENNNSNNNNNENNTTPTEIVNPPEVPTVTSIENIINDSNVTVSNNNITSIKYNTKASSIISTLTQNGAKKVEIKNAQNTIVSESAILGTGYKVFITNETQTVSYTIVIKGDTSGDGQITILDLLQVQKHIKGDKKLNSAYLQAADTSKDGGVTILDLLQVQKHIQGDKKL